MDYGLQTTNMGFLKKIFGDKKEQQPSIWKNMATVEDLEAVIASSHEKPVAIFKHSTRCSISSMAKSRLERGWDISDENLDLFYLDLIANRPTSNKVAELTGVTHQSPQLILIKKGKAVYDSSHNSISATEIKDYL